MLLANNSFQKELCGILDSKYKRFDSTSLNDGMVSGVLKTLSVSESTSIEEDPFYHFNCPQIDFGIEKSDLFPEGKSFSIKGVATSDMTSVPQYSYDKLLLDQYVRVYILYKLFNDNINLFTLMDLLENTASAYQLLYEYEKTWDKVFLFNGFKPRLNDLYTKFSKEHLIIYAKSNGKHLSQAYNETFSAIFGYVFFGLIFGYIFGFKLVAILFTVHAILLVSSLAYHLFTLNSYSSAISCSVKEFCALHFEDIHPNDEFVVFKKDNDANEDRHQSFDHHGFFAATKSDFDEMQNSHHVIESGLSENEAKVKARNG